MAKACYSIAVALFGDDGRRGIPEDDPEAPGLGRFRPAIVRHQYAGISKDFIVATFQTIHLNGLTGGERPTGSAYQFGMSIHANIGVPSAVRFAQLGMFRASYSFNLSSARLVSSSTTRRARSERWQYLAAGDGNGDPWESQDPFQHDSSGRFRQELPARSLSRRGLDGGTSAVVEASMSSGQRLLRADLHVHSYHSGYAGRQNVLRARDCYSEPEAVYRTAKARGMDLVTITDHDSIDGCLEFDLHPEG